MKKSTNTSGNSLCTFIESFKKISTLLIPSQQPIWQSASKGKEISPSPTSGMIGKKEPVSGQLSITQRVLGLRDDTCRNAFFFVCKTKYSSRVQEATSDWWRFYMCLREDNGHNLGGESRIEPFPEPKTVVLNQPLCSLGSCAPPPLITKLSINNRWRPSDCRMCDTWV